MWITKNSQKNTENNSDNMHNFTYLCTILCIVVNKYLVLTDLCDLMDL